MIIDTIKGGGGGYGDGGVYEVRQDLNELGRGAVRELGRLIEARQQEVEDIEPETIQYQPELIVRESSVIPSP